MATSPTPVTPAPALPDRTQRSTFPGRMSAFFQWMATSLVNGVSLLAQQTYDNAVAANDSAGRAEAYSLLNTTAQYRGAWSAITTYALGESVRYGGEFWLSNVNGNLGNAPVEGANWSRVERYAARIVTGVSGAVACAAGNGYVFTTAGGIASAPSNPSPGDMFGVRRDGNFAVAVDGNGKPIEGISSIVPLAEKGRMLWLTYLDATRGWCDVGTSRLLTDVSPLFVEQQYPLTLAATVGALQALRAVPLDADRTLLVLSGATGGIHAVVVNQTAGTIGASVLIRAANCGYNVQAVKSATDQVVVFSVSTAAGTAAEAVVLSVSGTTIAVGAAATATLAGAVLSADNQLSGPILLSGGAVVFGYLRASGVAGIRAVSLSGTTATIGAEVAPSGTYSAPQLYEVSGLLLAITMTSGGSIFATPYSVSGAVLTVGAAASVSALYQNNDVQTQQLASGNVAFQYTDALWRGAVVSVTGTTASISTVALSATSISAGFTAHGSRMVGSQLICGADIATVRAVNVLTDTAGVASAGAAVALSAFAGIYGGSDTEMWLAGGDTQYGVLAVGISGANPVVRYQNLHGVAIVVAGSPSRKAACPPLVLHSQRTASGLSASGYTVPSTDGRATRPVIAPPPLAVNVKGASNAELWSAGNGYSTAGTVYLIQRTRIV